MLIIIPFFFRSFWHQRIYDTSLGFRDRGGYPERHGEGAEEGLVLENSSSWMNWGDFNIATCQANSICDKGSDKNIFICLISDWIHLNQWNYTLSGYKWDTTQMSSNLFKMANLDFLKLQSIYIQRYEHCLTWVCKYIFFINSDKNQCVGGRIYPHTNNCRQWK